MLREVSDSLFEYLIEAFPTDHSYSRSDIEQDPMPPLMAHFLGQTLQHKLDVEVEHLRTVRSSWFNYDHPEVQHTYKSFVASLAQHSQIPSEEWRGTLKRTTKLVIAHLILPTHTLVEFVFRDDEGPLLAPVIYRQLSYFAAYPYLREAVETFLKKRQLKEIDRTRFSSLLSQIDRHMTASYTTDEWLRMLRPLFDLMRRVPQTRTEGIPIDLLSMFFGDKEAYEIQGRLQVEKEVHRIASIDEASLRRVIEGSVGPFEQKLEEMPPPPPSVPTTAAPVAQEPVSTVPPPPPPRTPVFSQPEASSPTEQKAASQETVVEEPATDGSEDPPAPPPLSPAQPPADDSNQGDSADRRPLWEQFQKPAAPAADKAPAPSNGTHNKPHETADADGSVPLWMQFQDKSGKKPLASSIATPKQTAQAPKTPLPVAPADEPNHSAFSDDTVLDDETVLHPSIPFPPINPNKTAAKTSITTPPPTSTPLTLDRLESQVLGTYGSSNRAMFVEHLFAGSRPDYEQFLHQLNDSIDWAHASKLIASEVFKKNQVNIYSPAAIMFTESVEEQFRQQ